MLVDSILEVDSTKFPGINVDIGLQWNVHIDCLHHISLGHICLEVLSQTLPNSDTDDGV